MKNRHTYVKYFYRVARRMQQCEEEHGDQCHWSLSRFRDIFCVAPLSQISIHCRNSISSTNDCVQRVTKSNLEMLSLFEKDTCDWEPHDEDEWVEEVVRAVFQHHEAKELATQLEVGQPLVQAEGTRCRVGEQRPVVHAVWVPSAEKIGLDVNM